MLKCPTMPHTGAKVRNNAARNFWPNHQRPDLAPYQLMFSLLHSAQPRVSLCSRPCGAHYKESLIHFLATPRLVAVKKAVFSLSTLASFIAPAPSFSLFEEANENSIDCVSKYPAKYSYFKGNGKRISKGPRVCICLFEADAVKSSWVKFHPDPAGSQMDWVNLDRSKLHNRFRKGSVGDNL